MSGQLFASLLYIARRSAAEPDLERDIAFNWASDVIWQGWEFGDRLRRRVQEIALAPWLRALALRVEAERLGDRRLQLIRPAEGDSDRHDVHPVHDP